MNDEETGIEKAQDKLGMYGEAARLTGSEAFFLIQANKEVAGTDLVALFSMMNRAGIARIIPEKVADFVSHQ
jgi:hypothetical protein